MWSGHFRQTSSGCRSSLRQPPCLRSLVASGAALFSSAGLRCCNLCTAGRSCICDSSCCCSSSVIGRICPVSAHFGPKTSACFQKQAGRIRFFTRSTDPAARNRGSHDDRSALASKGGHAICRRSPATTLLFNCCACFLGRTCSAFCAIMESLARSDVRGSLRRPRPLLSPGRNRYVQVQLLDNSRLDPWVFPLICIRFSEA